MLKILRTIIVLFIFSMSCSSEKSNNNILKLNTRSRIEISPGSGEWQVVNKEVYWRASETAIIICDMWDQHWCEAASKRVAAMAPKVNEVIKAARQNGVTIVHAPSSCIDFYKNSPARKNVSNASPATPPNPIMDWYGLDLLREAELPIDDSDGGCDDSTKSESSSVWTRQIASIEICPDDGISDNGQEIYNFFQQKGIRNVVFMGVHTNICVLGRSFGIRAQRLVGKNVVLVRDLTDAMYNPEMPPYVSHERGTELVIEHIEKYWAPTILSADLINVCSYSGLQPTKYTQTPEIAPAGGVFFDPQLTIAITTQTKDAQIRYTLDGSNPNAASMLYTKPFKLIPSAPEAHLSVGQDSILLHKLLQKKRRFDSQQTSAVVKAKAFKRGYIDSPAAVAVYSIVDSLTNGLRYKYYEGKWQRLPNFSCLNPLREGVAYGFDPSAIKMRDDYFGISYSGFIKIPSDNQYIFYLISDDGGNLYIDNQLIVDNDGSHGAQVKRGMIYLNAGMHAIKIDYFDDYAEEDLRLFYKTPRCSIQPVTFNMLFRNIE